LFRDLTVSGRRSRGVDLRFDDTCRLQSQIRTLGRLIGNDPAHFTDGKSFVLAGQLASTSAGIVDTRTLSQTRSGNAAQVGGGEQLPLSISSQSRQAARVDDVGGGHTAVSDAAVRTSNGGTELTRHNSGGVAETLAHSGDQGQLRCGSAASNAGAHHIAAVHTEGSAVHESTRRHGDAVGDVGPDVLVEIGGRDDDVGVQEGLVSPVLTGTIRLGVVIQLVIGAESLIAQVDVTDGLLSNPTGTEDHAHRATNGLVGVARLNAVGVLELYGLFFVPVTKNVGVVAGINLGNRDLVRVNRHC